MNGRKRLNLLVLSQLLPHPPDSGPKVRLYYVLRHLAEAHRITLLAFTRSDDRTESLEAMRAICEEVHTVAMTRTLAREARALAGGWAAGRPFIIERNRQPAMMEAVRRLARAQHFDCIYADQLWMADYARLAGSLQPHASLVLDNHNAVFRVFQRLGRGESNLLRRAGMEIEWRLLRNYESRVCGKFDRVVMVTEEDRALLEPLVERSGRRRAGTGTRFHVIPICIDPEASPPVKAVDCGANILHLGTMYWPPNIEGVLWFANTVWPKVRAQVPATRLTIVGKNPPQAVRELENRSPGVSVTGYVRDPAGYLEQASVFVVPLHSGGGMRVKILDGWRWGLPIVSTSIGAEGLEYVDGDNLLIADGEEAFASAVVRVLQEPGLAQRLRQGGRRWVEENYDWRTVYPAWDSVINHNAA